MSLVEHFLNTDDRSNLKAAIELGYESYPDEMELKIALCSTLIFIRDYDSAIKLIENSGIKNNAEIDMMRLECYCELDRYDETRALIRELTVKNSDHLEDALIQAAGIMNDPEKNQQEAYDFIIHALTLFPDNMTLKLELCFNLELQLKTEEALTLCRELIHEDPYAAEAWYMQGRIQSLCSDFEKAVESLDFALTCLYENDDLEYEIKLTKAYCLYRNECYETAITTYEELTLYDDYIDSEVEPYLAECHMYLKEYEMAYHILKRIIGLKDLENELSVYGNYIYCCVETERRKEAIDILNDALNRFSTGILEYLSTLQIEKKQPLQQPCIGNENILHTRDLARKYLESNLHNN
jgi:tetratricopeptide (TPR) repeat protein